MNNLKDKLDERYMAFARKFKVEPRKLLSYALEYRILKDGDIL